MHNKNINAGLQLVPISKDSEAYIIIDKAIDVIQKSGLKHQVTPLETVIEGPYDEVMHVIKQAQEIALDSGSEELVVSIRLHIKKEEPVSFEEKTQKYN